MNELIIKLEKYASKYKVPILNKESLEYIQNIIKERNIKSILELGSAVGYSAINFALTDAHIQVTTIERDEKRYLKAVKNIKKFKLENRINIINDDILNVNIKEKYDFIFIDASKSQNEKYFNMFKDNLNDGGIIIIDNLGFHGFVGKSDKIESRNLRSLVKKIEKFMDYLETQDEFKVKIVNIGDVIGLIERR